MFTSRKGRPAVRRGLLRLERLEARDMPAVLIPGDPVSIGTPTTFSGVGGTITSGGALNALNAFKTAIGGVDNGNISQPLPTGSRRINWDGVKLDGTDFGGGANTVVISPGKTVGIPLNRFQTRGVFFEEVYAVSGDGFASVNPNTAGKFPAFSPNETFAMFNENTIDLSFVVPSPANSTPAPAAARGFGAIFLNVRTPNTSSIEYFHGAQSLGKFFVPTSNNAGDPEFLGVLFKDPIVTKVTLTLGTDTLFSFNGTTFTAGGSDNPPTHNLVVTDDFLYPEPVPIQNAEPIVEGSGQGTLNTRPFFTARPDVPFTGAVATFSSSVPTASAKEFTAVIHWGDGHSSNGTVSADGHGGFSVSGTNTFHVPGLYPLSVQVQDFNGDEVTVTNTADVGAPNQLFLAQTYRDLLQREIDPAGLVGWGNLLDGGASRQSVVEAIERSPEYLGDQVQALFQHYLHRAAEPSAVTFFSNQLASGFTLEQVAAELAGSPEYFQVRGSGTNTGVVKALFADMLGRAPEQQATDFFTQVLQNGATTSQVGGAILSGEEYRDRAVNLIFRDFLRRPAESTAQTAFATLYNQGVVNGLDPFRRISALVLSSQEYFNDVQALSVFLPPVASPDFLVPNV